MTIIVEDGTGMTNSESYAAVSFCDTYHANLGNVDWGAASVTVAAKEAALRKAVRYLDGNYRWGGLKLHWNQALQWPRYDAFQDGWLLPFNVIPQLLINATAEAARIALTCELSPAIDPVGGVQSEGVGPVRVTYYPRGNVREVYTVLDDILRPLLGGAARNNIRVERG